jgi:hypothetical protein
MKARRKEIYDVIEYTPGAEDGFTYYNGLTEIGDFPKGQPIPKNYTHRVPYIIQECANGASFKAYVSSEVKILIYNGSKRVIPNYEF